MVLSATFLIGHLLVVRHWNLGENTLLRPELPTECSAMSRGSRLTERTRLLNRTDPGPGKSTGSLQRPPQILLLSSICN